MTAVIVAGGESFAAADARLIGMARARGEIRVIAINDAVYPCWFADIAYACDAKWWRYHGGVPGFAGLRLGLEPVDIPDIHHLVNTGTTGFDPDPGSLRTGGNSGYQALHLAAHLGARTVVLVGFDMVGDHWFGRHPPAIAMATPVMATRIREFAQLATVLAGRGIEVLNASPRSALHGFRGVELEHALIERKQIVDKDRSEAEQDREVEATEAAVPEKPAPREGRRGQAASRDLTPVRTRRGYETR